MKRTLRLGACAAAALAGVLAPASVAQADTTTTTTATADYVCESFTVSIDVLGWNVQGQNCTGPTDATWAFIDPPRTLTDGTTLVECDTFGARRAEFGPASGRTCRII